MHRRETGRQPDTDRISRRHVEDPERIAENREISKTVSDAIAALPDVYRSVLALHLRHGLNAQEISLALERPAGTVRTQITRGMEMLRRGLPAALATGGVVGSAATRGLASVRAVVLEAGARAGPTLSTTSAIVGGVLIMKKAMLVSGLVTTGALAWMLWPESPADPEVFLGPSSEPGPAAFAETPGPADPATRTKLEDAQTSQRQELDPGTSLPAELTVTLRGRCVEAANGVPAADCTVEVQGRPTTGDGARWEDPEDQVTGDDGVFSFTFVPLPDHGLTLWVRRQGAVPMTGRFSDLKPGTVMDLGDVPIRPGTFVTGRIVDSEGTPQAGVSVSLERTMPVVTGTLNPQGATGAMSREDGTFAVRNPLQSGEWSIYLIRLQLVEPKMLALEDGMTRAFLDIVVKGPGDIQTISGIVVDEQGAPVESARVERSFTEHVRTRADGTFRLEHREDGTEEPSLLRIEKEGYEILETERDYAWGESDLRLVLRRGLDVEVLVTDAETGEPVEDYGLRCYIDPDTVSRFGMGSSEVRHEGLHQGGRLQLTGVRRGRNLLLVEPSGAYLPSDPIRLEVTDRGAPLQRVELLRPTETTLEVVRHDGKPVAGTEVELVRTLGNSRMSLESRPEELGRYSTVSGDTNSILLQRGSTDPKGRLQLTGPAGRRMALRLLGPGHPPHVVNDVYFQAGDPLRIEVPSGATVDARIQPLSVLQTFLPGPDLLERVNDVMRDSVRTGVYLERSDGSRHPVGSGTIPVRPDGGVAIDGIASGDWDVYLNFHVFQTETIQGNEQSILLGPMSDLSEGETRSVTFDISHLQQARVAGRLLLNEIPLAGAQVGLVQLRGLGQSARVHTEPDGSYGVKTVPGDYRLRVEVQLPETRQWVALYSPDILSLSPGQTLEHSPRLRTTEIRIRVLSSDAETPAPGIQLYLVTADGGWISPTLKTDALGFARFRYAPLETLTLRTPSEPLSDMDWIGLLQPPPRGLLDTLVTVATIQPSEGAPVLTVILPEEKRN